MIKWIQEQYGGLCAAGALRYRLESSGLSSNRDQCFHARECDCGSSGWAMEASILRYDEGEKGFVRYTIQVVWRDLHWVITRRFSDFTMLHAAVLINTPGFQGTLPPKRWFGR